MKTTGPIPTRLVNQPQRMAGDLFLNGQNKKLLINAKVQTVDSEHLTKSLIMLKPTMLMRLIETKEWRKLS